MTHDLVRARLVLGVPHLLLLRREDGQPIDDELQGCYGVFERCPPIIGFVLFFVKFKFIDLTVGNVLFVTE